MIAVYATAVVKADKIAEFQAVVKPLIEMSLKDSGCVSYQCGTVQGEENSYAFVERWQSMADLQSHMQQPHFIQAGEKLADLLAKPLDIRVVDLFA
ncbi:putative quinol monooxygenase [Actinobacillus capsulatus]|uniref:putative quinol monooxygenase n=1 Tax=Actinobacillus capsulatus TaxID=717 RepID=UPI000378DC97|nr:putative quinol monooxygenase [Actinobacillus capsulatus]